MTTLAQSGISVVLPPGWEGRIYQRTPDAPSATAGTSATGSPGRTNPILHAANFPLSPDVGDYGGGAVESMTNRDLFVALTEFGPGSVGTALFAPAGIPFVAPDDFGTQSLQRVIEGQGGAQKFFTVAGRPFGLYVVLGSYARRVRTVPLVNDVLGALEIT